MKDSRLFAKHGDNHVHHWTGTMCEKNNVYFKVKGNFAGNIDDEWN